MVIWIAVVPGAVRMVVETVLAFAENEKVSNKWAGMVLCFQGLERMQMRLMDEV